MIKVVETGDSQVCVSDTQQMTILVIIHGFMDLLNDCRKRTLGL